MNIFIDSHTHIYTNEFNEDRDKVIQNAISIGVQKMMLPNIDLDSIEPMFEINRKYPENCFPMLGLHPCSVLADFESVLDIILSEIQAKPKIYAIGEIGLDYHWDLTFKAQQLKALRMQIKWAKKLGLPIVIHTRESFEDAIQLVEELNDDSLSGVFHCFGGTIEEAKRVINLGNFYLGIGGVSTFKNSTIPALISEIGLDNILLETDSPYLAPVPHRGKRNESGYIPLIAKFLAEQCELPLKMISEKTSENATKLFKL